MAVQMFAVSLDGINSTGKPVKQSLDLPGETAGEVSKRAYQLHGMVSGTVTVAVKGQPENVRKYSLRTFIKQDAS